MNSETRDNEPSGALLCSTSFTPGPWHVYANTVRTDNPKGQDVRAASDLQGRVCKDATMCDATLIAKAPELLKHLKHMIWLVETELEYDGGHIVKNAKAAIRNLT